MARVSLSFRRAHSLLFNLTDSAGFLRTNRTQAIFDYKLLNAQPEFIATPPATDAPHAP
jgi:hypothetical protein